MLPCYDNDNQQKAAKVYRPRATLKELKENKLSVSHCIFK